MKPLTALRSLLPVAAACWVATAAADDVYSAGTSDPANVFDAPVPGFIGPHGDGQAPVPDGFGGLRNAGNFVNPLFFGWALTTSDYFRAEVQSGSTSLPFSDLSRSLGPVTGDYTHVVSLGDLSAAQLGSGGLPGRLTLHFTDTVQTQPIRDLSGSDFVIFENGFYVEDTGEMFAELAYVEVSSDGVNFACFPSISRTPSSVSYFGSLDPTGVFNLAGKHANNDGECWGTPFDLAQLATDPLVIAGTVDRQNIRAIRVVDIPGNGSFSDNAQPVPHPIYDVWPTHFFGSGGFDLEAVGVISRATTFAEWPLLAALPAGERGPGADPNGNGLPNLLEYAFARSPARSDASGPLTSMEISGGRLVITFTRDERARDLTYEVQANSGLNAAGWTTIAASTGGQPVGGVAGFTPAITESRASPIASVGVLRKVRVADVVPAAGEARRFLRVKVTQSTTP